MRNLLKGIFGKSNADLIPVVQAGAIILDVRTPQEFATGHVDGAINIPVQELERRIKEVQRLNKPVITYCRSGMRSGQAVQIMKKHGVEAFNTRTIDRTIDLLSKA